VLAVENPKSEIRDSQFDVRRYGYMKKKRMLLIGIVIAVAIVAAVTFSLRKKGDDGVMKLSGNVEVTEAHLAFKVSGRIIELSVDEGSVVKAGQSLARLDSVERAAFVAQQQAVLQEVLARLAELKAGSRRQEIEQAKAQTDAQEAELTRLRRDWERAETLYRNGAISLAQYDATKSSYETRQALHRSSAETLSLVKEGPRKEDIRAAEQRVQQAKSSLEAAEERLRDTVLVAPFAGTVLKKNSELGETMAQGIPVFTLGDLENPWIKVYVKEDKLGLVKLGQPAKVSVDSFKGKTYEGTVTFIASEAEFTPKMVQTDEERVKLVFGVKVKVKNQAGELKPGMPADVRIQVKGEK
jgi:HlyD family secretion protein